MSESQERQPIDGPVSPYLLGASWLVRLAEANVGLSSEDLVKLMKHELEIIRANENFRPDEMQLVDTHERVSHRLSRVLQHGRVSVK